MKFGKGGEGGADGGAPGGGVVCSGVLIKVVSGQWSVSGGQLKTDSYLPLTTVHCFSVLMRKR
jgi:hypothetical protein